MEEIKPGDRVRLVVGVRTWGGTLWPKGTIAVVASVQAYGLWLVHSKGDQTMRGVPFDAVELAGKDAE